LILAIDAGNTRIKWGLWQDRAFVAQGSVLTANAGELADALRRLPRPQRAIGSNVADDRTQAQIEQTLAPWQLAVRWIRSQAAECGVVSGYAEPAQLGSDRWAALVGAHARRNGACVVANIGTAATVDALDAEGRFLGGLILPGPDLMARALAQGTAGLPQQPGRFAPFPTGTADAIHSGALQAICGAIERIEQAMIDAGHARPQILLSGGAAHLIAPLLHRQAALAPSLVLEGLIEIARA
jgi:type III pantothenate kinase